MDEADEKRAREIIEREKIRGIIKEYDEECEKTIPPVVRDDTAFWTFLVLAYLLGVLFTFVFIQRHAEVSSREKDPSSFIGSVAWPIYWAGYAALSVDDAITEARRPAPLPQVFCSSDKGMWQARRVNDYYLCDDSKDSQSGLVPFNKVFPDDAPNNFCTYENNTMRCGH